MDIDIPPRKSKKLFLIGILIWFFLSNICQRINKGVHEIDTKSKISGKNSYLKFEICFDIILKSEKLKKMTKINAHKEIFSILDYEIKNNIHALEIEIGWILLTIVRNQKFFYL